MQPAIWTVAHRGERCGKLLLPPSPTPIPCPWLRPDKRRREHACCDVLCAPHNFARIRGSLCFEGAHMRTGAHARVCEPSRAHRPQERAREHKPASIISGRCADAQRGTPLCAFAAPSALALGTLPNTVTHTHTPRVRPTHPHTHHLGQYLDQAALLLILFATRCGRAPLQRLRRTCMCAPRTS